DTTGTGYLTTDRRRNTTALVDLNGTITQTTNYHDYGKHTDRNGNPLTQNPHHDRAHTNPFLFGSEYTNPDNQNTQYTPARTYSTDGYWTSRDTYQLHNRFNAFDADPINQTDPTGHMTEAMKKAAKKLKEKLGGGIDVQETQRELDRGAEIYQRNRQIQIEAQDRQRSHNALNGATDPADTATAGDYIREQKSHIFNSGELFIDPKDMFDEQVGNLNSQKIYRNQTGATRDRGLCSQCVMSSHVSMLTGVKNHTLGNAYFGGPGATAFINSGNAIGGPTRIGFGAALEAARTDFNANPNRIAGITQTGSYAISMRLGGNHVTHVAMRPSVDSIYVIDAAQKKYQVYALSQPIPAAANHLYARYGEFQAYYMDIDA
ncbi:hypothetical protein, partial [Kitasatospora sp. MBT63]|uniref:hypothetical protein n=1 Tax=Kitasatospora sp. MBT63 TaxID=1444768 RepID=UPI0013144030